MSVSPCKGEPQHPLPLQGNLNSMLATDLTLSHHVKVEPCSEFADTSDGHDLPSEPYKVTCPDLSEKDCMKTGEANNNNIPSVTGFIKRNPARPSRLQPKYNSTRTRTRSLVSKPGRRKSRGTSVDSHTSNGSSTGGLKFTQGQEVLARWNDGLLYLGHVLKVVASKCYIKFEDGSEYWALFKDIQKGEKDGEIICSTCSEARSEAPDEIVLCDNCGVGYHQQCHKPEISSDVLKPDVPWQCRHCIFAAAIRKGGAVKTGPEAEALQAIKLSLPYDLSSITWDSTHKSNKEECYCYCGGPGDWFMKMLQCCRCRQWFHEACIQCLERPILYGDRFYIFVCSACNAGPEYVQRLPMKWIDIAQLALFNLNIVHNKKYHDFESSFIPWVEQAWDRLMIADGLNADEQDVRNKSLLEVLESNKRFKSGREVKKRGTLFCLRVRLPPQPPTIILPEEGQITEEVMNNLQRKGRKTITFVAVDSQSPIPLKTLRHGCKRLRRDLDDSFGGLRTKRRRVDDLETLPANQSYGGYSGDSALYLLPNHEDVTSSTSCNMLDMFIPRPSTFAGHNHPFKLHIEQSEELEYKRLKRRLLNSYQNDSETEGTSETVDDGESDQLETMSFQSLDVAPSVSSLTPTCSSSGADLGPPKLVPMVPLKKKRGRKKRAEVLVEKAQKAREQYLHSLANNENKSGKGKAYGRVVNLVSNLKSSIKTYFGANSRLENGEGFRVLGKRMTPEGKLQYLIEWEGLVS